MIFLHVIFYHIRNVTLVDNRDITNPYINLAIEEYLVRNADCSKRNLLLLYINKPSVVLGKNQCIYKEVNMEYLRNDELLLCRRISGGGTVYQDEGNLCFSFIQQFAEHKVNNYRYFNQPVVEALHGIGVAAEMDVRNNITCQGKKISGNAQFTNRKNIISHGTLLVSANLKLLRASLSENDFIVETKAVGSVRSSVANLPDVGSTVTTSIALRNYLAEQMGDGDVFQFTDTEWQTITQSAEAKFQSFEWVYGRTPKTVVVKPYARITIDEGIITNIDTRLQDIPFLAGIRYTYTDIKEALGNNPNASFILGVLF